MRWANVAITFFALACTGAASAHTASDSFLVLERGETGWNARWDIALRDLDYAVGLDADGDGAITWGELRAAEAAVSGYALSRLDVSAGGATCAPVSPWGVRWW